MSDLADRVRKARESWVEAGGRRWLIRRPTHFQMWRHDGTGADLVFASVVGWELKELDIVPGGGGNVPPFDPEAFREWIEDKVELIADLGAHVEAAIKAFNDKREAASGN